MLVVGLTGGIATGKSSVSNYLKSNGVPVVDADILAREVVEPGTSAYRKIVANFGSSIVLPDGKINRPKLGSIVFNDEAARLKLNHIVHPSVRTAMLKAVVLNWLKGEKVCIVDVPLLIEAGLWVYVGKVVVVYCSEEVQLSRLMIRDKATEEVCLSRIKSQMPIEQKRSYADKVIDNSGTTEDLKREVDNLLQELYVEIGWTWWVSWLLPPIGVVSAVWTFVWRSLRRKMKTSKKE